MSFVVEEYDSDIDLTKLYNDLMGEVWKSGYEDQAMYDFVPHHLEWMFRTSECKALHIENEHRTIGFLVAVKRSIRFAGMPQFTFIRTLSAVAPRFQRRGMGYAMLKKMVQLTTDSGGCDWSVGFLDHGHSSLLLMDKFAKKEVYGVKRLARLSVITKMLDVGQVHRCEPLKGVEKIALHRPVRTWLERIKPCRCRTGRVRLYEPEDLKACQDLLNEYGRNPAIKLCRTWPDVSELAKQLHYGNHVRTLVFERDGRIMGLINYYTLTLRGIGNIKAVTMENIHISKLSSNEQDMLFSAFLRKIKEEGCAAVISLNFSYYPKAVLKRFHFISYPRHTYLTAVGKKDIVENLPELKPHEIYFDFR